jgi:Thermophilic metalloprotease (M29)
MPTDPRNSRSQRQPSGSARWRAFSTMLWTSTVTVASSIVAASAIGAQVVTAPPPPPAPAPDWSAVARKIVERLQLIPGERVALVVDPGQADELVEELLLAVRRGGGTMVGLMAARGNAPPKWRSDFTNATEQKPMQQLVARLAEVDVGIMLPGATATDAPYKAFQYHLERPVGRGVRTVHFHWAGAYATNGTLLPVTKEVAELYQRALLDTDYAELARQQLEFERAMRRATVNVTTPAGTDLTFRIGNRVVTRQDGDASQGRARDGRTLIDREVELPAGAIRVAPIEESVEGTIAFPDGTWGGVPVTGLVMHFSRGRLVTFTATSGREGVERELAQGGDGARAFREFALGFNPLLSLDATDHRWIPYYGYGAGVVRLSLGDNRELGGKVGGGYIRWNFFTDATVTVGTRTWVDGGVMRP